MREKIVNLLNNIQRTKRLEKSLFFSEMTDILDGKYEVSSSNDRHEKKNFQNFFIGDIKNTETIVTTYYDTGMQIFSENYDAVNHEKLKVINTKREIIKTIINVLFGIVVLYFIGTKFILHHPFSIGDTYIILATIAYFIGLRLIDTPEKRHTVHNDSSVITLFDILEDNKNACGILTDGGFDRMQGDRIVSSVLEELAQEKLVIMFDCIGANSDLVYATNGIVDKEILNKLEKLDILPDETNKQNPVMIYSKAIRIYPKNEVPLGEQIMSKGKSNMEKIKSLLQ